MPSLVRYDSLKQNLLGWITELGAQGDLDFALDAGDIESYDGTSQSWVDLTGNGNGFYEGTLSTVDAADPSFTGTPDGLSASEYFEIDSSERFTSITNPPAYVQSWHKNNAKFTIVSLCWVGSIDPVTQQRIFSSSPNGITPGIELRIQSAALTGRMELRVSDGSVFVNSAGNGSNVTAGEWFLAAVTLDEAAATGGIWLNTTKTGFTSTYASPTASNTTGLTMGTNFVNSSRMAMVAGWSRELSDQEITDLYAKIKQRFTSLP